MFLLSTLLAISIRLLEISLAAISATDTSYPSRVCLLPAFQLSRELHRRSVSSVRRSVVLQPPWCYAINELRELHV